MGRPREDHVPLGLKVPAAFKRALQLEAIERGVPMSEIVVEAVQSRITITRHNAPLPLPVTAPRPPTKGKTP